MAAHQDITTVRSTAGSITRLVNVISLVMLAGMMLVTVVDVILRYFFESGVEGNIELVSLALLMVIFSGLAYTASLKGHVRVDLVVSHLRPRTRAVLESITGIMAG